MGPRTERLAQLWSHLRPKKINSGESEDTPELSAGSS